MFQFDDKIAWYLEFTNNGICESKCKSTDSSGI